MKAKQSDIINQGHHLLSVHKPKEALNLVKNNLDFEKPSTEGGRYIKAFALHHMHKDKEATVILFKRLEYDPNDIQALSLLISTSGNIGERLQAIECADKMIKISKKNNSLALQCAYIQKASLLKIISDDVGAVYYYKKALGQFKRKNQKVKKIIEDQKEEQKKQIKTLKEKIKGGPDMRLFEFLGHELDNHGKSLRHNKSFMSIRRRVCVQGKKLLGSDRPTDLEKELD